MSARHRRRKREARSIEQQVAMLERFYRPAARIFFTRYMRQLLELRMTLDAQASASVQSQDN